MRMVYICSPYRAKDSAQLDRNIEYAQQITRQAIAAGLAPITPHLYMTQCLNEDKPDERELGITAGLELLKNCDLVIVGTKYGISEGMVREITAAATPNIQIVDATELMDKLKDMQTKIDRAAKEYARYNACSFCKGGRLHTCIGYSCHEPYQRAYEAELKRLSLIKG